MTIPRCPECGGDIAPGLLACPACGWLVHGAALSRIAAEAKAAEAAGDRTLALSRWRGAVDLLPPGTVQRTTIDARMSALSAVIDGRAPKEKGGGKKAGGAAAGAGAVGLAVLKSKALITLLLGNGKLLLLGLLKLPTLLSMFVYFNFTSNARGGAVLALGILLSIYVHEIGHVAALRRYGIEATSPMFIPGFGAVVRMKQYPTDAHEEARTGLAGPLWGLVAASIAFAIGKAFALPAAISVASLGATINMFNLIPVWQLDGARGLKALSRSDRGMVAAVALASAFLFHQWMPAAVGGFVAIQVFSKSAHPTGDRGMFLLYVGLLVALSAIAMLPVQGIPGF